MKYLCISAMGCCLLLVAKTAGAQSFTGYNAATYAGLYGAFINPANILNHRVRADINLAGIAFSEANNIVKLRLKANGDAPVITVPTGKTGVLQLHGDVLGPSFLLRLSDKHAFAVSTRARVQFNADKLSASLLNLSLLQDVSSLNKTLITAPGGAMHAHAWNELAFTYSRQVAIATAGVWKAAASVKLVSGQGAAFFKANGVSFIYNDSLRSNPALQESYGGATNAAGNLQMAYAGFMDDWGSKFPYRFFNRPALAADVGISYEYRDEMQVYNTTYSANTLNYKWKAGAAITDIGTIKYTASPNSASVRFAGQTYVFNDLVVPADSTTLKKVVNYYKATFDAGSGAPYFAMALPSTLHLQFDYNFNKWFSTAAHFSMPILGAAFPYYTGTHQLPLLTITPRAELPLAGAYMPISYHFAAGLQWGAALRLGPLVMGSATAFSTLLLGKGKGVDGYAIVRIPFFGYREYRGDNTPAPRTKMGRLMQRLLGCPRL